MVGNGLCGSCRYWRESQYPEELADENGDTVYDEENDWEAVTAPGRWGSCQQVAEFGPTANDKFYVVDGSHYAASLHTREEFGCTEWAGQGDHAAD